MTLRFRHVVFDLDGTLADTAQDIANAANYARRLRGLPDWSLAAVRDCIGDGARQLIARVIPGLSELEIDRALRTFLDHYQTHLLDETRVYPGIDALLDALTDRGVTCSVLSNKPAGLCHQLLVGLGIASHFVAVLGGDSLRAKKPDPCGLEHLQTQLQLPAADMLFVGDSLVDWQTARAAGVAFCGVAWGFATQALPSAARVVQGPGEIRKMVCDSGDQSRASRLLS